MPVGQGYRKYLDPRVLAKIGGLELRARVAVEGYIAGAHRSPYHGSSVEFADHRSYSPGDDIRHIDWKVFARTDKHYIKEYEQETNLCCVILLDCSGSMEYQSAGASMSKREYGACVAASLAYIALQQRDAVGLVLFDEQINEHIKPSCDPGHWKTLVKALEGQTEVKPAAGTESRRTRIRAVLDDLAGRVGRRTLLILISDLFDDHEEILLGLKHLRYRKNDVIVCNVWDPAELRFPFDGPTLFVGMEDSGRLMTEPHLLRSRYVEEVTRFMEVLRHGCRKMHIDYVAFDTSKELDAAISAYLATRSASIRHRTSRVLGG